MCHSYSGPRRARAHVYHHSGRSLRSPSAPVSQVGSCFFIDTCFFYGYVIFLIDGFPLFFLWTRVFFIDPCFFYRYVFFYDRRVFFYELLYIPMLGITGSDYQRGEKSRKYTGSGTLRCKPIFTPKSAFLWFLIIQRLKVAHEAAEICQKRFELYLSKEALILKKTGG